MKVTHFSCPPHGRKADIAAFMEAELGRGLSAKTVKSRLDCLHAVLRYLETQGCLLTLPERPALTLPGPLPCYPPRR